MEIPAQMMPAELTPEETYPIRPRAMHPCHQIREIMNPRSSNTSINEGDELPAAPDLYPEAFGELARSHAGTEERTKAVAWMHDNLNRLQNKHFDLLCGAFTQCYAQGYGDSDIDMLTKYLSMYNRRSMINKALYPDFPQFADNMFEVANTYIIPSASRNMKFLGAVERLIIDGFGLSKAFGDPDMKFWAHLSAAYDQHHPLFDAKRADTFFRQFGCIYAHRLNNKFTKLPEITPSTRAALEEKLEDKRVLNLEWTQPVYLAK